MPVTWVTDYSGRNDGVPGPKGQGTHVAIEAIFVHVEIGWGVAQVEEAREEWREGGATARRRRVCGRRRGIYVHRRPWRTCGSGRSGTSFHSVVIMEERRKKGRVSIGGIFSETRGFGVPPEAERG
jgi:hypothetical protein